ncbi:MAG TPA: YceI family protein [Acidimicrobiia bacterium]|nr:YceI family protein [Acidimicrobiia bacterium]
MTQATVSAAELAIPTGTWKLEPNHTTIGFVARHLMVTKVRGHFADFEGTVEIRDDLAQSSVDVTLQAASVTTGSPDRDGHLRSPDFFDVENYPDLRFTSTELERRGEDWIMRGDLTIKDITRPVELNVSFEGASTDPWGKTRLGFSAHGEVDREAWGLTWNVPLEHGGFLVSKHARLEIETQLVQA